MFSGERELVLKLRAVLSEHSIKEKHPNCFYRFIEVVLDKQKEDASRPYVAEYISGSSWVEPSEPDAAEQALADIKSGELSSGKLKEYPLEEVAKQANFFYIDEEDYMLDFRSWDFIPDLVGEIAHLLLKTQSKLDTWTIGYSRMSDRLVEFGFSGGEITVDKSGYTIKDL